MEKRTPLIAGNWKMYKTTAEAVETARELVELTADVADVDMMIAPTYTALDAVSQVLSGSKPSSLGSDVNQDGLTNIFDLLALLAILAG